MSVTLTAVVPMAKNTPKRLEDVDEPQSERIEVRCRPSEKKQWEAMARRKGVGISSFLRWAANEFCEQNRLEG